MSSVFERRGKGEDSEVRLRASGIRQQARKGERESGRIGEKSDKETKRLHDLHDLHNCTTRGQISERAIIKVQTLKK